MNPVAVFLPHPAVARAGAAVGALILLAACTITERPPSSERAADSAKTATSPPPAPLPSRLLGRWVQPVPGQHGQEQGVRLLPGGYAQAINTATRRYDLWRLADSTVILSGASIGTRVTSTIADSFSVRADRDGTIALVDRAGAPYEQRDDVAAPAPRCFESSTPELTARATLFLVDSTVTGRVRLAPREKDSNDGAFEGVVQRDSTLLGTYHFYSEGLLSARDAAFRIGQGQLTLATAPMEQRGDRLVFQRGQRLTFGGPSLREVACGAP
ncbi:MAG: lipocalin family protein [Gemmatimonadaceae bacterium]|jgi:hypothetical protein|nr:lipocalin family protein [Gemmatimonadaceae bacterium]